MGPEITNGMEFELKAAKEMGIPVEMYDFEMRPIRAKTLMIDDRVDERTRELLKDVCLE